jgi:hypothetical protein
MNRTGRRTIICMLFIATFAIIDIQRRCEQRWAARFARRVPPSAPHEHIDEKPDQQLALARQNKKENPPGQSGRLEVCTGGVSAGSKPPCLL